MSAIVIRILPGGFFLEQALSDIPGWDRQENFSISATTAPFDEVSKGMIKPNLARRAGARLLRQLHAHKAVKQALSEALSSEAPIYIFPGTEQSDLLPWEMLWNKNRRFFALNAGLPIGRLASSPADREEGAVSFASPLKILVVLGAVGVEAGPEWEAFKLALRSKPANLDIEIRALVAEESVRDAIAAEGIQVEILQQNSQLFRAINEFEPHIVHFFCHGAVGEVPHLLIATWEAWNGQNESGSLSISPDELTSSIPLGIRSKIWLVVLNCCGGDESTEEVTTLTRTIVQQGICAAIGMRQAVRAVDANLFTEHFYSEAFQEIGWAVRTPGQDVLIEWVKALYAPRRELCRRYLVDPDMAIPVAAEGLREWTIPVLYKRRASFRVRTSSSASNTAERDSVELDELVHHRASIVNIPSVSARTIAAIDVRIGELTSRLYPEPADPAPQA